MDLKSLVKGLWDRIGGWGLIGLGVLLLFLGWLGVSETVLPSEQIPYVISAGLGGIACIGVGATMLLSADLRDEWRKLDALERVMSELAEQRVPDSRPVPARRRAAPDGEIRAAN